MNELYEQIVKMYGEDPAKIQPEEFFGIFKTFVASFEVKFLPFIQENDQRH